MKILAYDTSTNFLSIALIDGNKDVSVFHEDMGTRHNEILVPKIKEMLDGVNWEIRDIDLICVGIGPGSFTGLRIGATVAKGIEAITKTKTVGVPSMDAVIMNADSRDGEKIAIAEDARKGKIYACIYENKNGNFKRLSEYMLVTAHEFVTKIDFEIVVFGDAIIPYKHEFESNKHIKIDNGISRFPEARNIARLGAKMLPELTQKHEEVEPLYLHSKEANITIKK